MKYALTVLIALAACSAPDRTPTAPVLPNAPSFFIYPTLAAPTNLAASVGATSVDLTWEDNSPDETDFNVRFANVCGCVGLRTWHVEENVTNVSVPIVAAGEIYGIEPGTYDVTVYALGYYFSNDPAVPSTNTWSGPSNTIRITVGDGPVALSTKKGRK